MSLKSVKVSIGLPIYNGENFVSDALDSILAQDFQDFEIVISDNASTDNTERICRAYESRDKRIRYYRNDTNLGASRNFNRTFSLSRGMYFKWAAHDDVLAPDYLSKCVEVLDSDRSIVLCFTRTKIIDESGKPVMDYEVKMTNADSYKPEERFKELITVTHWGIEIFGLFRSSTLGMSKLMQSFPGSDRTLMAEMSLLGRFHEIQEFLFFNRDHSERSIRQGTVHSRSGWFDTSKSDHVVYPHWRTLLELIKCINSVSLSLKQQAYCYLSLFSWLVSNYNFARLIIDIPMAIDPRTWSLVVKMKEFLRIGNSSNNEVNKKLDY